MVDYHYNLGVSERGDLYNTTRSGLKMYGNSIHLYGLYNINNRLSVGAGAGLDRYENTGHNTLPLFLTGHYVPIISIPHAYAYTNLGYAIPGSTFTEGMLLDLGIGYRKMFRRHFGMNFQFGYNLKQLKGEVLFIDDKEKMKTSDYSQWRHSLAFGVGFIF
ncbi:MAG: hypothetical protein LBF17_06020 [Mediterranea sp.]|nr:hypothetical protein [Mediterranea sp.]